MRRASGFWRDQAGAVTLDWIVLASAIILLGLVVVYSIYNNSAASLLVRIDNTLTDIRLAEPGTLKPFSDGASVASAGSPVGGSSSAGSGAAGDGTPDSSKNEGTNGEAAIGEVAKSDGAKSGNANGDGGKEYGTKSVGAASDWSGGGKGGGGKAGPGG